jgi:hypothetical protein
VCRLSILGENYVLISGVEAANFMGTRAGKDCLRSKGILGRLKGEFGAKRMLTGEDGDSHKRTARHHAQWLFQGIDQGPLQRACRDHRRLDSRATGRQARMCQSLKRCSTWSSNSLALILTGAAPLAYVKDIRTAIIYILNVLVTRQRPRILLKRPEYRKARAGSWSWAAR